MHQKETLYDLSHAIYKASHVLKKRKENKLTHIWPLSEGATTGYVLPKRKKLK